MIDGAIILETEKITKLYDWQILAVLFFVIFLGGMFLFIEHSDFGSTTAGVELLAVSILLVVSAFCTEPKFIGNRYKVYTDEQCNISELLNDYNIISSEGRILIIEDKESVEAE